MLLMSGKNILKKEEMGFMLLNHHEFKIYLQNKNNWNVIVKEKNVWKLLETITKIILKVLKLVHAI